ncbi:alcohol dehydrogenase transcription factor myb/sant-like [Holotrichia oblita]|uniref:Alcohol dehydrogenase transcription factor myb/sant-like n=1 Tax=Holotrichia oblita TaxID=644536 RepID=A0ACB9SJF6_HOLOL|nr:alcohol dehydrogenase transcription factor myb/sant-like [Holotrichia oblita]
MSDDPIFNIKFVELVEKYPCIYDYRRQDHSKRDVVEKAWSAIGSELKLSGKQQFITPFMKSKPQQGNLPTETEPSLNEDNDSESDAEKNIDDHSEQGITGSVRNSQERQTDITTGVKKFQEKNPSTQTQCSNNITGPSEKRRKVSTTTLNEADKYFVEYIKSKTSGTYSAKEKPNPDLQFLTSLLPDLAKLTDYQKRQFKKRTLELLDELLCDGPSQNNTMVVPIPTPSPVYSSYSTLSNVSAHSNHSFSSREYGEQPTPVQTYIQSFSDGDDRNLSLAELC